MYCPFCSKGGTKVIDSRLAGETAGPSPARVPGLRRALHHVRIGQLLMPRVVERRQPGAVRRIEAPCRNAQGAREAPSGERRGRCRGGARLHKLRSASASSGPADRRAGDGRAAPARRGGVRALRGRSIAAFRTSKPSARRSKAAAATPGRRGSAARSGRAPTSRSRWWCVSQAEDRSCMTRALELARLGIYSTPPNPAVGCVLVRDGRVVGEGHHRRTGGPHAGARAPRQPARRPVARPRT